MAAHMEPNRRFTRFRIIPRETVRASLEVLEFDKQKPVLVNGNNFEHDNDGRVIDFFTVLLQDPSYIWPLAVQHGSYLWREIKELIYMAFTKLSQLDFHNNDDISWLANYLISCPEFHIKHPEVSVDGCLLNDDPWIITHPQMKRQYKDRKERKKFTKLRKAGQDYVYVDHSLASSEAIQLFDKIMMLARIKSLTHPHDNDRQIPQYQNIKASLRVPRDLAQLVFSRDGHIFEPNDAIPQPDDVYEQEGFATNANEASINEAKGDTATDNCQTVLSGSRTIQPIPMLLGARTSYPASVTDKTNTSTLEVWYAVIFQSPTEKVTIKTSEESGQPSLKRLVKATQMMWSWMISKGYDNVRLADVVELVQEMQVKDGVGGSVPA